MTSNQDPSRVSADQTTRDAVDGHEAAGSQTPRLVVSWLIVGLPLVYGIYQTVSKTLPFFGG